MKISEIADLLVAKDCKNVIQAYKNVCAILNESFRFSIKQEECWDDYERNVKAVTVYYRGYQIAKFWRHQFQWKYQCSLPNYGSLCKPNSPLVHIDDIDACIKTIDRHKEKDSFDQTSFLTYRPCPIYSPRGIDDYWGTEDRFVTARMQRYLVIRNRLKNENASLSYYQEQIKAKRKELREIKQKAKESAAKLAELKNSVALIRTIR